MVEVVMTKKCKKDAQEKKIPWLNLRYEGWEVHSTSFTYIIKRFTYRNGIFYIHAKIKKNDYTISNLNEFYRELRSYYNVVNTTFKC
jgi:hypothetical protein